MNEAVTPTTILIGDLLVRSEMAAPSDMANAVPISLKTGLPIGRVLIGAGALTEAHLQQSLLAQSLIRDSLLSVDLAVQALRIVVREGFNLEQALRIVGWQPESFANENRLGQLLVSAEVITQEQLDAALKVFYTAGLPLARVLVVRGVISNLVAYAALTSQQLLRENKLSRDQAVMCVKAASVSRGKIEDNYVSGYLRMQPMHNVRLGELLVLSGIASEADVMQAVEWAITRGETLGDVFVSRGIIGEDALVRALETQRLVTKGYLDPSKAGEVLKKANYERISVSQALDLHAPAQLVRAELHQEMPATPHTKNGWRKLRQRNAARDNAAMKRRVRASFPRDYCRRSTPCSPGTPTSRTSWIQSTRKKCWKIVARLRN
jgi:predicted small secreted protein